MPGYFGALTIVLLMGMVLTRVFILKRRGVRAMHFGKLDKKDFLIPPFALFYFYLVCVNAFHLPGGRAPKIFGSETAAWVGVFFCGLGVSLLLWSLISFGRSFRVGIDVRQPDKLITSGIFAVSRNPIYVAFISVLSGEFLIFAKWIFLVYVAGAALVIHRQVLREEKFLKKHYGAEYEEYCKHVRRYL